MTTVEEEEYPQFYHLKLALDSLDSKEQEQPEATVDVSPTATRTTDLGGSDTPASTELVAVKPALEEGHHVFTEDRKGISYDRLFGPYISGASKIIVTDPYVRFFYQIRNMMELVEMVIRRKSPEDQVCVHLATGSIDGNVIKQRELLDSIADACVGSGVEFTWAFNNTGTVHVRDIVTDTGWKIVLDRGLDIFQAPIKKSGFSLGERLQEHRIIKGFYITYVRNEPKCLTKKFVA